MNDYTTTYEVTTTTGNGAKCIHKFDNYKEAKQLMEQQSYFEHELKIVHTDLEDADQTGERLRECLMPSDPRYKEYNQGVKDCFGFYARNAAQSQDELAKDLLNEGFSHIYSIFGSHPIKTDWLGFTCRQAAACSLRHC